MSTSRERELWRHSETNEAYLVELEAGRVVAANGPIGPDEVGEAALAWKQAAQGRSPAFDAAAAELEQRRDEFERERVEAPG